MHSLRSSLLIFILFISLPIHSAAQELTTVILIRHAETVEDGTDNPALNKEGEKRAQELSSFFKRANITAIYSTALKRTEQTARPLAVEKGLEITNYDPFDQGFLDYLLAKEEGGTVLISGHSNTTPHYVNVLIGEKRFAESEESDYGNIFIITVEEKGEGKLVHLRY